MSKEQKERIEVEIINTNLTATKRVSNVQSVVENFTNFTGIHLPMPQKLADLVTLNDEVQRMREDYENQIDNFEGDDDAKLKRLKINCISVGLVMTILSGALQGTRVIINPV